ncbi:hypothetical protein MMC16_003188 [Acarospora aff. strigata]|nr:hypothetical protein [Acarospora aff. strigata]
MRSTIPTLLLAISSLTLAAPAPLLPHHTRQLTPPNLPYPTDESASTCPVADGNTNLFTLKRFLPHGDIPVPHHFRHRIPKTVDPRALHHICHEVAAFTFAPLGQTNVKTQGVTLNPGLNYVFSVAADAAITHIVAWGVMPQHGNFPPQAQFLGSAHPGQNAGTLALRVHQAIRVFFIVAFSSAQSQGEVGLFEIGPPRP